MNPEENVRIGPSSGCMGKWVALAMRADEALSVPASLHVAALGCAIRGQRGRAMTVYQGRVKQYGLFLLPPSPVASSTISLDVESVGRVLLLFAPHGGTPGHKPKECPRSRFR